MKNPSRSLTLLFIVIAWAIPAAAKERAAVIAPSRGASVSGIVHSVDLPRISILGGAVVLDLSEAKIVGPRGEEERQSSVRPGMRVHAVVRAEHTDVVNDVLRVQVLVIERVADGNLTGDVQAIDLLNATFNVLGETIVVTPETSFWIPLLRVTPPTLADLHVNDPVAVDVAVVEGRLTALRVQLLHPMPRPTTEFSGIVKSMSTEVWVITDDRKRDISVRVTSETKILGSPIVGDRVDVFGHVDSANEIVALSIVKSHPSPKLIVFRGTVRSVGRAAWTIVDTSGQEIVVRITGETRIAGDPQEGDLVEVTGHKDEAGTFTAVSIVKSSIRPVVTIRGTVQSIGTTVWTILDEHGGPIDVQVGPETKIYRSPKVGDRVEIAGVRDASGRLTALSITPIHPVPPPPSMHFEGTVRAIAEHEWMIDSVRVIVSARTKIAGAPGVGDKVRVTGLKLPDGSVAAWLIEKI